MALAMLTAVGLTACQDETNCGTPDCGLAPEEMAVPARGVPEREASSKGSTELEAEEVEAALAPGVTALCTPQNPLGEPFSAGPYGDGVWEVAADFTLPTLDGSWNLKAAWTGCESYTFITYDAASDYSKTLWNTSLSGLLKDTPANVHYFVVTYATGSQVSTDIQSLKAKVDKAMRRLPPAQKASWNGRLHYVSLGATELGNWVSQRMASRRVFAWSIDRLQRVREAGYLAAVGALLWKAEIATLANESKAYNFEWEREQRLEAQNALVLPVLQQVPVSDPSWSGASTAATVNLPDAATLAKYDTLELDLGLYCPDHLEENCPEWDYLNYLYLCDAKDTTQCNTIFSRWITTYGREGRWVTDVSPLLALLKTGGPRVVRYYSVQYYLVDLSFRLSKSGKTTLPSEAQYLYSGGAFNETYNDRYTAKTFTVPADVKRVELYAAITGHGYGDDANCAEFCNHDHHFLVNGQDFIKAHPEAGTSNGCTETVDDLGTVPNQYGTWFYGRGGWCPGLDVKPWVVDITSAVKIGGTNSLEYRGLYQGQTYYPSGDQSFAARIDMESWLVYSR